MIETDYKATSLWRTAFEQRAEDKHAKQRERLARAYDDLRDAVKPLLEQTAKTLPQLTDHSGFHVDQLWEVASTICGPGFPLNPLEGFILGAAFAFHDSALTIEAYDGGLPALKETRQWRDALMRAWQSQGVDAPSSAQMDTPPSQVENFALFTVLRLEHAKRAEQLPLMSWNHPTTGAPLGLFSDTKLRDDYGRWIGLVAASHHWTVRQVLERLNKTLPHASGFPTEWDVDLLKVACILRCADAAAIDDRRAPARLFAIRQPVGVSRLHWAFQDNLFPAIRENDALIFRSKRRFTRDHMNDWWLAYDAIRIVAEEVKASNAALGSTGRPVFAVRNVAGEAEPTLLKQYIEVQGWDPINTQVRITNIKSLVDRLGGAQLYGQGCIRADSRTNSECM